MRWDLSIVHVSRFPSLRFALHQLGDFGHADLMPTGNKKLYTRDCGTTGYKAPELKSDWKLGHGLVVSCVLRIRIGYVTHQPLGIDTSNHRRNGFPQKMFAHKHNQPASDSGFSLTVGSRGACVVCSCLLRPTCGALAR